LEGLRFRRETALPENEREGFAAVAQMELRAELFDHPGGLQFFQHAHFLENPAVVGQQRFADIETGEMLLLQNQHAFAGARQIGGRRAATRSAADNQRIVQHHVHQTENRPPEQAP
jgi:hypothetical protein